MNEKLRNHPLNGIGLEALLGDLVREYGWEVLAEQLPISCFKNYPSFKSSVKFLHKTEWARERLEDLYLYKFLQYPLPQGEQKSVPPRNRIIEELPIADAPASIEPGDAEFFAVPATTGSRRKPAGSARSGASSTRRSQTDSPLTEDGSSDPWAKWRK